MKMAIQGHPTRGKEVIQILESLGGINRINQSCRYAEYFYYVSDDDNTIAVTCVRPQQLRVFTLEEFEKEFPFKIGDIVLLKGVNKPYEVIALEWYMNKLCYKLDNELHYCPETLTTYEKMKEERNVALTLDKAKEWYNKGGELKEIALQAFTEKELNPLPRSWEEFGKQSNPIASWRYNIPIKYEALFKLEQLRNCWRDGWEPSTYDTGYGIFKYPHDYIVQNYGFNSFLSFPTKEMTEEFLKCFRDLIEKAGDLI